LRSSPIIPECEGFEIVSKSRGLTAPALFSFRAGI
jgi:hypothetical protein